MRVITLLVFLVPFLMGLGVDLYVPSLPALVSYYHSTTGTVQLSISLYMLGYGVGQMILGTLSDHYGRRKILVASSLCYGLISFISSFSPNIYMLNLCRLIQGLSVGGMAVVGRAMVVDCYKGKELAKATNYFGLSWSLGPILGPFAGGYFQAYFSWKADFYFFGIYGLFIFILALLKLPETNQQLVELNLKQTFRNIWEIVKDPMFIGMTVIGGFGYASVVIFNTMGPFLIQSVLGYSSVFYGYIALVLGVSYFFGSIGNRASVGRYSIMSILLFGLLSGSLFSLVMIMLELAVGVNLLSIIIPVLLLVFVCGFIVPNTLARSMELFSHLAGTASSVFGSLSGVIVSLVTAGASDLKVNSQLPMSLLYFALMLSSVVLYFNTRKKVSTLVLK
ncbi:Bcr/CflA subfamily drug resistance transporter [Paenibacillus forsythiae]|uniref:Bcr/CflA family efflux transporter n=1 Tax=Paenibacillus forsythiae TaxID=365616 RepID=A0ABU3H4X5_9BACL|nr:multidrug effflux MFS transporter [Paenibacillus forsythiae]MDT3425875.1 Bcr/CflA subfamily drug resistance transporter [Paenibacillus forsythiae]